MPGDQNVVLGDSSSVSDWLWVETLGLHPVGFSLLVGTIVRHVFYNNWDFRGWLSWWFSSVQFISVSQSCPTLCNPMDCRTPGFPVYHLLPEFTQTHIHWVGDAIQPSHPLSSPSSPALNLSQHQGLFKWVRSLYKMVKILEFQL